MKKKVWIIVLLFLGIFEFSGQTALARMNFSRTLQGSDRKVTELMILAMQARDAGDLANAELFWMHARELKPSLQKPAWLDQKKEPVDYSPADDEILRRVAALPYDQARLLLEQQINRSPDNRELRARFLELAQRNSDHVQGSRHASVLEKKELSSGAAVGRFVILLILLVLLVWQVWAFVEDFRNKKSIVRSSEKSG